MADQKDPHAGGTVDLTGQQKGKTATGGASSDGASLLAKFEIPQVVREKYPDLVALILETESMNDDERQYWFQILPIMTDDQVTKLREILINEKKELEKLDKDYQKEIKRINDRQVSEWKTLQEKEKREKLKKAEANAESTEKSQEEDLLNKLQQL